MACMHGGVHTAEMPYHTAGGLVGEQAGRKAVAGGKTAKPALAGARSVGSKVRHHIRRHNAR